MLWLLRLFPQFRELEALAAMQAACAEECGRQEAELATLRAENQSLRESHDQLTTEKLLLADRLDSALQDKDRLWETAQECLRGERFAYQTMVNHSTQKTGAGIPFPDAHSIPATALPQRQTPGPVGRSARMLPSEAAARNTNKFIHDYVERVGPAETPVERVG